MSLSQLAPPTAIGRTSALPRLLCLLFALSGSITSIVYGDELTGEQIYQKKCIVCHGVHGEGTRDQHPQPLVGELAPDPLAALIAQTMPADNPGTCIGEDSKKVAAYIFEAFYSPAAQARNQPVRRMLSHLTVRQYRHAVADLIASFRKSDQWRDQWRGQRGLAGRYMTIGPDREGRLAFDRLDPQVRFDFGKSSPDPDKIAPADFSIYWEGALYAPETGDYEFILRTENAARLYVNDLKRPLVDGWVKSGSETEYRAGARLLGGRVYPLRLHYSKAEQGVKRDKTPLATGSIALLWRLPDREPEVIPPRYLVPGEFPETLVVETSFPPDDRSTGFERGTAVNREWEAAVTNAAIETAEYVRTRLPELSGVGEPSRGEEPRLRDFCRRFAERAFRRPLDPDQQRLYIDRPFETALDVETAVERVVLLVLNSPRFLYPVWGGEQRDGYDAATSLALALWDSIPDAPLLEAAAAGQLATREQVAAQARRMMADPRFGGKIREFLLQWMRIDQPRRVAKDPALFPEFSPAVASDLRTSLDLLIEDVLASPTADFRQLLTADQIYLNGRLARIYGVDLPAEAPFQKVPLEANQRAGVLTHPYLMAAFADQVSSSPIRRGVFLARGVLGRTLRPPPEAVVPIPAALHPNLTTRERVSLQTNPQSCQACHGLINPLGFALERFDALGRLRTAENQRPIDAAGSYTLRTGDVVKFEGARELAGFLAGTEEVRTSFAEKLFYYLVKQPPRAFGPRAVEDARQALVSRDCGIRALAEEIAVITTLPREKRNGP